MPLPNIKSKSKTRIAGLIFIAVSFVSVNKLFIPDVHYRPDARTAGMNLLTAGLKNEGNFLKGKQPELFQHFLFFKAGNIHQRIIGHQQLAAIGTDEFFDVADIHQVRFVYAQEQRWGQ
jgi:hypothetical protein